MNACKNTPGTAPCLFFPTATLLKLLRGLAPAVSEMTSEVRIPVLSQICSLLHTVQYPVSGRDQNRMLQLNGCGYLNRYNLDDFRLSFKLEKLVFCNILGEQGQL